MTDQGLGKTPTKWKNKRKVKQKIPSAQPQGKNKGFGSVKFFWRIQNNLDTDPSEEILSQRF